MTIPNSLSSSSKYKLKIYLSFFLLICKKSSTFTTSLTIAGPTTIVLLAVLIIPHSSNYLEDLFYSLSILYLSSVEVLLSRNKLQTVKPCLLLWSHLPPIHKWKISLAHLCLGYILLTHSYKMSHDPPLQHCDCNCLSFRFL